MTAAMKAPAPADGIHPGFAQALDAARTRAKESLTRADAKGRAPVDRIEQLVREGKLPPRPGGSGVGYEPTPEEILGDLGEASAPEGTEDLPDAATVLSGASPEAPAEWGAPPGVPAPRAPVAPPGLAQPAQVGHPKGKRRK